MNIVIDVGINRKNSWIPRRLTSKCKGIPAIYAWWKYNIGFYKG